MHLSSELGQSQNYPPIGMENKLRSELPGQYDMINHAHDGDMHEYAQNGPSQITEV